MTLALAIVALLLAIFAFVFTLGITAFVAWPVLKLRRRLRKASER